MQDESMGGYRERAVAEEELEADAAEKMWCE
jgi:hypothetical protein